MANSPEEIRLRYLYRRTILSGKVRLPLEAAKRLIGPDCAYHLYATMDRPETEVPAGEPRDTKETND